jgi:hypothetical protein
MGLLQDFNTFKSVLMNNWNTVMYKYAKFLLIFMFEKVESESQKPGASQYSFGIPKFMIKSMIPRSPSSLCIFK